MGHLRVNAVPTSETTCPCSSVGSRSVTGWTRAVCPWEDSAQWLCPFQVGIFYDSMIFLAASIFSRLLSMGHLRVNAVPTSETTCPCSSAGSRSVTGWTRAVCPWEDSAQWLLCCNPTVQGEQKLGCF
uniref:Uncharacterized protein n=1 Tax=Anser cygnoides TaxID=8845 RepID=A0A8B9E242_ANSCY